ncbi:MAG: hypothetical protein RSO15_00760 [Bacteroides sp.]|uniref:hypothetical protein n=1 Tax=Bacteroides sp. TaxID=29523 RepID=UPI002FCB0DAF
MDSKNMTLKDALEQFEVKDDVTELELEAEFRKLAPSFLYGGYIDVDGKYRIYIRTVEFYFHAEEDSTITIKDPIVYHRNNRYVEGKVPYFPLMSFHAHLSGFDITFESEKKKYRASALIRVFEVYDEVNKRFLIYNKEKAKFVEWHKGMKYENKYKHEKIEQFTHQSTYIYDFLNGFCTNSIKWKNDRWEDRLPAGRKEILSNTRKNVYCTHSKDENNEYLIIKGKEKKSDERKWSFRREDDVRL